MTSDELAWLKELAKSETYAICLPEEIGRALEKRGFARWVPPVWGSAKNWQITEAGRTALAFG